MSNYPLIMIISPNLLLIVQHHHHLASIIIPIISAGLCHLCHFQGEKCYSSISYLSPGLQTTATTDLLNDSSAPLTSSFLTMFSKLSLEGGGFSSLVFSLHSRIPISLNLLILSFTSAMAIAAFLLHLVWITAFLESKSHLGVCLHCYLGACQGVKSCIIGGCFQINKLSFVKTYTLHPFDPAPSGSNPTLLAPTGICFLALQLL